MNVVDETLPPAMKETHDPCADPRILRGARAVLAAAGPARAGLDLPFLADAAARGWFTPAEDETVRIRYAQYLSVRAALLAALFSAEDACSRAAGGWLARLPAFSVALAAACLLLRQSRGLAPQALACPLLGRKLDEASPCHGIPRKTFARMLRAATDPVRLLRFRKASAFYEENHTKIAVLAGDPALAPVVEMLAEEMAWVDARKREIFRRRLDYRWFSLLRRQRSAWKKSVFGLFEWSGRAIAELRQPGVKSSGAPKRITPELREKILRLARPGDVFVTRHDDALSNLFLPGFWPHAALHLGTEAQRAEIGLEAPPPLARRVRDPIRFLEAKKDGVRFRPPEDTLAVDALVILRPPLAPAELAAALARAMRHEGKLYDFTFDFRNADRLACTEVVYRAYHGAGPLAFSLIETGGRLCLPAEELIAQCLEQEFRVAAVCGLGKDAILTGIRAELALHASRTAL